MVSKQYSRNTCKFTRHAVPVVVRIRLIIAAQRKCPNVRLTPASHNPRCPDGFMIDNGMYQYWFNTPDHSTHVTFEMINSTDRSQACPSQSTSHQEA